MADIEKINPTEIVSAELLGDLRKIIDTARSHVAAFQIVAPLVSKLSWSTNCVDAVDTITTRV